MTINDDNNNTINDNGDTKNEKEIVDEIEKQEKQ